MSCSKSRSKKAKHKKRIHKHTEGWLPGHSDLDMPFALAIVLVFLAAIIVLSYLPATQLLKLSNVGPHPSYADIVKATVFPTLLLMFSIMSLSAMPNQIKTFFFDEMPTDEQHPIVYYINRWSAFIQLLAETVVVSVALFTLFHTHDIFILFQTLTGQLWIWIIHTGRTIRVLGFIHVISQIFDIECWV